MGGCVLVSGTDEPPYKWEQTQPEPGQRLDVDELESERLINRIGNKTIFKVINTPHDGAVT